MVGQARVHPRVPHSHPCGRFSTRVCWSPSCLTNVACLGRLGRLAELSMPLSPVDGFAADSVGGQDHDVVVGLGGVPSGQRKLT